MTKVIALSAIVFLCVLNVHANYPLNASYNTNSFVDFPEYWGSNECVKNEVIDGDAAVQLTPFPEPATLVILGLGTILVTFKKRPIRAK
ncbi:MAG: hypothetical protein A2Y10_09915 [Planctomycetes bacterium GWF2_41_51]|nr:MAG: hypothetical protein A2Y10_09915 [Planctomycetes bacterium GWF2_41_51]HBG27427.1 hypothetical protein [Phycisphaerales bacterium]